MMDILDKRGLAFEASKGTKVQRKVPEVKFSPSFKGAKTLRSVSKTAITAFVVLYGNEAAQRVILSDLRAAVRYAAREIEEFSGWDFTNPWPVVNQTRPHRRSLEATVSGFEHSVVICEVRDCVVAYVELFGNVRFSMRLGPASGVEPKGLAINPRSVKAARFTLSVTPPSAYRLKDKSSFKAEHAANKAGLARAFAAAARTSQDEARSENSQKWASVLEDMVADAGTDENARSAAMRAFAERMAAVEFGSGWQADLNVVSIDDEGEE